MFFTCRLSSWVYLHCLKTVVNILVPANILCLLTQKFCRSEKLSHKICATLMLLLSIAELPG